MAQVFSWDDLGRYKAEKRFLDGYPPDQRTRRRTHGSLTGRELRQRPLVAEGDQVDRG